MKERATMRFYFLLSVTFLVFISSALAQDVSKIIAMVNNQGITTGDLDEYCQVFAYRLTEDGTQVSCDDKELRGKSLKRLIEDKLVLGKAKNEDIRIPRSWIENRFNKMVANYSSREELEKSLVEKGLNVTLLKEKIKEQYLMRTVIDKYVKSLVHISPTEVSSYYFNNKDQFYSSAGFVFYVAKSESDKYLREISQAIKDNGIDETAGEYSDVLLRVGLEKEQLEKKLLNTLERLKVGGHTIVKIEGVRHLVYLEKDVEPKQLLLTHVKDDIRTYLDDLKFQKQFANWISQLKQDAVIKEYDE